MIDHVVFSGIDESGLSTKRMKVTVISPSEGEPSGVVYFTIGEHEEDRESATLVTIASIGVYLDQLLLAIEAARNDTHEPYHPPVIPTEVPDAKAQDD